MTGSLSLLVQAYPDPKERAEKLGLYGMIGGSSIVFGPVAGGILTDTLGWRTIFLINLPIGALTLRLGRRAIPESSDPGHAALDPLGQVLGLVLLASLTYGLIERRDHGWSSAGTLTALVAATGAAGVFVWVEPGPSIRCCCHCSVMPRSSSSCCRCTSSKFRATHPSRPDCASCR
jgi:DHA2 family methylenomycin A resistance protein-like MFS transporter